VRRAACAAAWLLALACAGADGSIPLPAGGGVAPDAAVALAFSTRIDAFYARLVLRRVDALETFNDAVLREHFRSRDQFFDYYADLAYQLQLAHFEQSRPSAVRVEEFVFESPTAALVQVRFTGNDGRPLRPNSTSLVRRDRWEFADGSWWLVPAKL
jgi:hypothetical protein